MLDWALALLILALISAAVGFSGVVGIAATVGQLLFVVFVLLFAVVMVARRVGRQPPD